jgi:ABC-type Mn2+/Zn2+ transport system permease subunit
MKHVGKVQASIAFLVIFGFFAAIWMVLSQEVNPSMRDALLILIGSLGAAFGAVVQYYFGSSSGSARKDELYGGSSGRQPDSQ